MDMHMKTKHIIILCDGMSDNKIKELHYKTPLQVAHKPNMDYLAKNGEVGRAKTVPDTLPAGSDVANLSVIGFDPKKFYTGRSPLEAVSMGIELKPEDMSFRANLVTLSDDADFQNKTMLDYSSDEITTRESSILIEFLKDKLENEFTKLYSGISYRHCMVFKNGNTKNKYILTPPHDISGKKIGTYLPKGEKSDVITDIMKRSYTLLEDHEVNIRRREHGQNPASSLWIWGEGTRPALPLYSDEYGVNGAVITAVDLIKGIAKCTGLDVIEVEGATGNINTNFYGKAKAAVNALKNEYDFVFLHIEAPDECGHRGEIDNKVKSIEMIDEKVVGYILNELDNENIHLRVLLMPDHPTPLDTRTHSKESVPYILYDNKNKIIGIDGYNEDTADSTKLHEGNGYRLAAKLLEKA